MTGLSEWAIGWPITASAVPGNDQSARSARVWMVSGRALMGRRQGSPFRPRERADSARAGRAPRLRLGVPLVGGFELRHELREKPRVVVVVRHGVVVHEIAAAAAEHLAHRCGG